MIRTIFLTFLMSPYINKHGVIIMKKISASLSFIVAVIMILSSSAYAVASDIVSTNIQVTSSTVSSKIMPRKDRIGWRYKTVNGKHYKRQYNYSRKYWIGEWELC